MMVGKIAFRIRLCCYASSGGEYPRGPPNSGAVCAAVFRPSRKSNQALATDLEPVSVRTLPRFEAIRAAAKHQSRPKGRRRRNGERGGVGASMMERGLR
jgi:hypothetical protein